jgi:hypothetical protein
VATELRERRLQRTDFDNMKRATVQDRYFLAGAAAIL